MLLRAEVVPTVKAVDFDAVKVAGTPVPRLPFRPGASALAGQIEAVVTGWARELARAIGEHRPGGGVPVVVAWMLNHGRELTAQPWAGVALDELVDATDAALHLVGPVRHARSAVDVECILCGAKSTVVQWRAGFDGPFIVCRHCATILHAPTRTTPDTEEMT